MTMQPIERRLIEQVDQLCEDRIQRNVRIRDLERALDEALALIARAVPLVGFACDVPQRELEAQQWLDEARRAASSEEER